MRADLAPGVAPEDSHDCWKQAMLMRRHDLRTQAEEQTQEVQEKLADLAGECLHAVLSQQLSYK